MAPPASAPITAATARWRPCRRRIAHVDPRPTICSLIAPPDAPARRRPRVSRDRGTTAQPQTSRTAGEGELRARLTGPDTRLFRQRLRKVEDRAYGDKARPCARPDQGGARHPLAEPWRVPAENGLSLSAVGRRRQFRGQVHAVVRGAV